MSIVLNEKEFAINAIDSLDLGSKPYETVTRIAKYYYASGYKKAAIEKKLDEFLLKCNPDIILSKWQGVIASSIKSAKRYKMIEIDGIPITKKEIDICSSINGKQMQRLMFTLICAAKYYNIAVENNNCWVNCDDKEIFSMANIVTSTKKQSLMIHDLRELGLIRFSKRVDNIKINVTCLDPSGEPEMYITDFRNIGYQYMRYFGEPYFECESCGKTIKRVTNNQKYCRECAVCVNRKRAFDSFVSSK